MTTSKKTLHNSQMQSENEQFVKKTTLYIIATITFGCGLFLGNLITTLVSPTVPQQSATIPQQTTSDMPAGSSSQISRQISQAEAALITDPQNISLWNTLGHLYFDSSQHSKAINAYTTSLNIQANQPNIWTDLGVMFRRTGQAQQAITNFDTALKYDPDHQTAQFNKGIVLYYDMQKKQEALAVWQKLLAQHPSAKTPSGKPLAEMIKTLFP